MTILPRKVYNKWWVLIAVAMGVFLATIDGSIVNIGLNTLVEDMQKPLAVVEWVVLAYMLTLSTLLLSIGRLSDIVGKKKLFLAGMILFTISSGLCGLAGSVFWLIGFRVLQAVGGSMIMAIGTAIVTEAFPPQERGKALGIMGTMVSIGIIAGPTIGGLLLQSLTWHWLFFVNLPIGFIGVFMVLRFVPESTPGDKQKFDFAGAGLLFVSMASFLFALTTGQHGGFDNLKVIGMFVLSVSALSLFIGIERRTTQPMIDLTMFRNAQFSINLITGFLVFICTAGTMLIFPLYLQNILQYDPQQTGLMLAITPVTVAFVAPLSGALSDRVGSRPITTLGLLMLVIGYLLVSTLTATTTTIGYLIRFIPIGIGIGLFQSPNNSAVMGSVSRERLGVASGLLALTRTVGQTTGIAVLGAFWENRVAVFSGGFLESGATHASTLAQVSGLTDTIFLVIVLIIIALLISIWALFGFYKSRKILSTLSK
jgi:EmrB/QacA subfamily drug resistance transporter